ncbi:MAG: hypothetical protein NZM33_08565 [Bryobacteraceae bacterium]|nr:hypothetical protein [Bryobacteraceae bacterium]
MLRIVLFSFIAMAAFAQSKSQTTSPRANSGAKEKGTVEKTLPAGAEETSPGIWRYTDAAGKTWIYRRTPFGLVKTSERESGALDRAEPPAEMRAFEDGDRIRFERVTPFGVVRWDRNKSELDDLERAVWEREQKRRNASPKAEP